MQDTNGQFTIRKQLQKKQIMSKLAQLLIFGKKKQKQNTQL